MFSPVYARSLPNRYMPPVNFGMVEDEMYRSGQPSELNFPFLEKLRLKVVVYLAVDFLEDQEIRLHQVGGASSSSATTAWDPISEEVVLEALELVLDPRNYPLLIMCNLGRHRTGTIVGCLRKLQHWSLTAIFEEYRRFAGSKVRVQNEQFIELFDTDLVRVTRAPPWLVRANERALE